MNQRPFCTQNFDTTIDESITIVYHKLPIGLYFH